MPTLHRSPGEMRPGAVRSDEPRGLAVEEATDAHHVDHGDAFGDAGHGVEAGVDGFEDGIRREGRGHEDHAGVGAGLANGVGDGVEDGAAEVRRSALARRDSRHEIRAVLDATLPSGNSLRCR